LSLHLANLNSEVIAAVMVRGLDVGEYRWNDLALRSFTITAFSEM